VRIKTNRRGVYKTVTVARGSLALKIGSATRLVVRETAEGKALLAKLTVKSRYAVTVNAPSIGKTKKTLYLRRA
jgi:hypothetical protein